MFQACIYLYIYYSLFQLSSGAWVNHSIGMKNCRGRQVVVDGIKHILLVTDRDVPKGTELFHNYGDTRKGVPSFLKY